MVYIRFKADKQIICLTSFKFLRSQNYACIRQPLHSFDRNAFRICGNSSCYRSFSRNRSGNALDVNGIKDRIRNRLPLCNRIAVLRNGDCFTRRIFVTTVNTPSFEPLTFRRSKATFRQGILAGSNCYRVHCAAAVVGIKFHGVGCRCYCFFFENRFYSYCTSRHYKAIISNKNDTTSRWCYFPFIEFIAIIWCCSQCYFCTCRCSGNTCFCCTVAICCYGYRVCFGNRIFNHDSLG